MHHYQLSLKLYKKMHQYLFLYDIDPAQYSDG